MFISAVNAILTALRELTDVRTPQRASKYWIMYSNSEQTTIYPFISLKHISTTSESSGIGQNDGVAYREETETFVAIAGQKNFYLTKTPLRVVSLLELTPDSDPPQTYPDYYYYNTDYSVVIVRAGVPLNTQVDITYNYAIESYTAKSRQVTHTYNIKVEIMRNTATLNDELFDIADEHYANGKLLDYMTNLVWDKLLEKYTLMRGLGWAVSPTGVSEEIYDADTRLFTKIITLTALGSSVTPPPVIDEHIIYEVPINVVQDGVLAPIPIARCETDEGWNASGDAIAPTVNASLRKEGQGALNLGKSAGTFTYASYSKVLSNAIDLTGKAVYLWIFIRDINELRANNTIELRLSNPGVKYYRLQVSSNVLTNGWNLVGADLSQWVAVNAPDITQIDRLRIFISTDNVGDSFVIGNVIMDFWNYVNLV